MSQPPVPRFGTHCVCPECRADEPGTKTTRTCRGCGAKYHRNHHARSYCCTNCKSLHTEESPPPRFRRHPHSRNCDAHKYNDNQAKNEGAIKPTEPQRKSSTSIDKGLSGKPRRDPRKHEDGQGSPGEFRRQRRKSQARETEPPTHRLRLKSNSRSKSDDSDNSYYSARSRRTGSATTLD